MTQVGSAAPQAPIYPFERRIDIGDLLTRTVRVFGQAPWAFIVLALIPLVFSLPSILIEERARTHVEAMNAISSGLVFAQSVAQTFFQAASIHGAARLIAGDAFDIRESIGVGARRFAPFIGAGIIVALAMVLGFLLFIVPGFMVLCAFALAGPAIIVEKCGPIAALKRSAFLTRGNRWRLFGAVLVVTLIPGLLLLLVVGIAAYLLVLLHLEIVATILMSMITPIISAIGLIMTTQIFFDLRGIKEGLGPRQSVTQVFD